MNGILKELLNVKFVINLPKTKPRRAVNLSELSDSQLEKIAAKSAEEIARNSRFPNLPGYRIARERYSDVIEIIDRRKGLYPDL